MSGHVLPFFGIAGAELRWCEAAVDQHRGGEDCATSSQHVGGEVHLVIDRAIEPAGGHGVGAIAVHDVSRDNAGAAEANANGFGPGGEFALFAEVTDFLVDFFRHLVEKGVALQHQPNIVVTLEERGDRAQRAGTHQVVVAHKKAELAGGLLDQAADIAVVAEVGFVFAIAQRPGITPGIITRDGGNLLALGGDVFADDDLEIAAVLGVDGVEQRRQMPRPVVGGNADGEFHWRGAHAFSQAPVAGWNCLRMRAGIPPTIAPGGTSPRTTELAARIAPLPMLAGPTTTTLSPIQTLSAITTGPPPPSWRWVGGSEGGLCAAPL